MKARRLTLLVIFLLLAGCLPAAAPAPRPIEEAPTSAATTTAVVTVAPVTTTPTVAAPAPMPTATPLPSPVAATPASAPTATPAAPRAELSPLAAGLEGLSADAFFDESYKRLLLRSPEYVTAMGLARAFGSGNDRLTDLSESYLRDTQALERAILELLLRYDPAKLTPAQQLTADIYAWYLDDRVRGHAFAYDDYPLNPTVFSVHNDLLQFFTDIHPIQTAQDGRDYVARLTQIKLKFEQVSAGLQQRERAGVTLPQFLIPSVVGDLRAIADASPTRTPFYTVFAGKVNALAGLAAAEKQTLLADAEQQIATSVIPAYRALIAALEREQTLATNDAGVWKLPDGAAYYAYLLRHHTTTDLTADQIHELGKLELARIHGEMRQGFAALGYDTTQDLSALYNRLAQEGGLASGGQIVAGYEQLIRGAEERLAVAFDQRPQARVIVIGGPTGGYYMPPAVDGSRPGAFYAQNTGVVPRYTMPSLAYHEAVPGHHFQLAIAQELDLPILRGDMGFTGHIEGWALYAERLAQEMGLYENDPYGDLGRLQMEAFRAARLVVDTGLHAKRWSFDQAVNYMVEATGRPRGGMQAEVARYVSIPGQATAYYVGFLKILALRQRAKDALGDRFDLKKFHNVLLANGAVPLEVLERLVDAYIATAAHLASQASPDRRQPAATTPRKPPGRLGEDISPRMKAKQSRPCVGLLRRTRRSSQ